MMFISQANFFPFIIISNQRRVSSGQVIAYIIEQHFFEKLIDLNPIVWRRPINLSLQTLIIVADSFSRQSLTTHCLSSSMSRSSIVSAWRSLIEGGFLRLPISRMAGLLWRVIFSRKDWRNVSAEA